MPAPNTELLRKAYAIIAGIPEHRFDLVDFVSSGTPNPNDCGTIACAAGWLAMHPDFCALGLTLTPGLLRYVPALVGRENDPRAQGYPALADVFGLSDDLAYHVFASRECSRFDDAFLKRAPTASDKAVFLNRVRRLLAELDPQ